MREFNVTGTCVKRQHYMVDTSKKIDQVVNLIERGKYFTINRPRQYGKTTTLSLLRRRLEVDYTILSISFEQVGKESFVDVSTFVGMFYRVVKRELKRLKEDILLERLEVLVGVKTFEMFDDFLTDFITDSPKEIILMIDECDDGSNNDVFLKFLGVLRKKYLFRTEELDVTFKSVILAGVHDIKSLRYKVRGDGEEQPNSPWNIAENFNVDMSFNEVEIGSLLLDYLSEHPDVKMDVSLIASKIHYFTNGYPFLVSYLCKMIDEEFEGDDKWSVYNLEQVVNELLVTDITNFDILIKNIEIHEDLANLVRLILIEGESIAYSISGPAMKKGLMYGVLVRSKDNKLIIHNPIYEAKIYSYFMDKAKAENFGVLKISSTSKYVNVDGTLDMPSIMESYSRHLKDLYDDNQNRFVENNARLLFSIFMKSIINGTGFMYREPVISDRRRLDVMVTYNHFKYVIELKIWYGEAYYKSACEQLADYLERESLEVGYMLVHDFRKEQHRRFTDETVELNGKVLRVYFV